MLEKGEPVLVAWQDLPEDYDDDHLLTCSRASRLDRAGTLPQVGRGRRASDRRSVDATVARCVAAIAPDDERHRDHIALHESEVVAGSSPEARNAHANVRRQVDRVLLKDEEGQSDSFST